MIDFTYALVDSASRRWLNGTRRCASQRRYTTTRIGATTATTSPHSRHGRRSVGKPRRAARAERGFGVVLSGSTTGGTSRRVSPVLTVIDSSGTRTSPGTLPTAPRDLRSGPDGRRGARGRPGGVTVSALRPGVRRAIVVALVLVVLGFFAYAIVDAWNATGGELPSVARLVAAVALWMVGLVCGGYAW